MRITSGNHSGNANGGEEGVETTVGALVARGAGKPWGHCVASSALIRWMRTIERNAASPAASILSFRSSAVRSAYFSQSEALGLASTNRMCSVVSLTSLIAPPPHRGSRHRLSTSGRDRGCSGTMSRMLVDRTRPSVRLCVRMQGTSGFLRAGMDFERVCWGSRSPWIKSTGRWGIVQVQLLMTSGNNSGNANGCRGRGEDYPM